MSIYPSRCLSIYLSIYLSIDRSIYLSIDLSIYRSIYLSIYLDVYLPVYLQDWKPSYSACETSSFFKAGSIKNAAILRDLLVCQSWQHQKRSSSARLPHFSKLTTSKTKQFRETSFKNGKLSAELTASYQCVLRFFQSTCRKYCAFHEKSDAKSYEVLHLSRKIISANLKTWCSKMQPLSGNQRPELLTSLMNMSFVLRLPCEIHLWRSSSHVPRLPSLLDRPQNPHVLLTFDKVHNPLRLPRGTRSERPKVLRTRLFFFALLTWKCASRHNRVHLFDISTSKSGPRMVCFVHFDFEMWFAPQRRAIFHFSSGQLAPHPPL